jgi:hypothetical protein
VCIEGSASRGGLGRAGEQGRGSAGVWGVAPVDGERGRASGTRKARERERKLGEGERGRSSAFIEREREMRGCCGDRQGGRPSMAPLGREHGGGWRERVESVSSLGGGRARGPGSVGRSGRARAGGARRSDGAGGRREGEERGGRGGVHM